MFKYFNIKLRDGKRFYEERVVLSDVNKIKSLEQLKNEFIGMTEREKAIYSKMYFDRFSQMGGMR